MLLDLAILVGFNILVSYTPCNHSDVQLTSEPGCATTQSEGVELLRNPPKKKQAVYGIPSR